ncbi:hypothetical protein LguiA_014410 [Lonicera macranthoides]
MEEEFPCPLERTVASALLLLSTSPNITGSKNNYDSESLLQSNSRSSASSAVSSKDCSSNEIRNRKLQMIAIVTGSRELKLKVVRKSRSKTFRISDCQKISGGKSKAVAWGSASETSEASSCLSSGSSSASSCNAKAKIRKRKTDLKRKEAVGSILMRRRAEDILGLLSIGCASEVRIRQLLGDSPDTSKALRMLLKKEEVKRTGAGGRLDPYIYTKA